MVGVSNLDEVDDLVIPLSTIEYEYVPKPKVQRQKVFPKRFVGEGNMSFTYLRV
jgi:hypothetical protein